MDFADIHYEIPNITEPLINWDDLNMGKIDDMLKICPKFNKYPAIDFLPLS